VSFVSLQFTEAWIDVSVAQLAEAQKCIIITGVSKNGDKMSPILGL